MVYVSEGTAMNLVDTDDDLASTCIHQVQDSSLAQITSVVRK